MPLLLTILSVLAAWAFLAVLVLGLLLVLKTLQSVRGHLERIAMGVRAIQQQTRPLGAHASTLVAGLGDATATAASVEQRIRDLVRQLRARTPAA